MKYNYRCTLCNHEEVIEQSMKDNILRTCTQCGKDGFVRIIEAGGNFILKGDGWQSYEKSGRYHK